LRLERCGLFVGRTMTRYQRMVRTLNLPLFSSANVCISNSFVESLGIVFDSDELNLLNFNFGD
jgi:hypothetical protein